MGIVLTGVSIVIISAILYYAYKKKKIDKSAIATTGAIGVILLATGSIIWIIAPFVFFVGGTVESQYKKEKKKKLNAEQKIRTCKNVFANGGAAAIFAFCYILTNNNIFFVGMIASVSTALADTSATELGQVYGKNPKFFLDFFRKEPKRNALTGNAGAVTIQGFIFALIGSVIISAFLIFYGYSTQVFLICCIFGFLGCVADSLLGSTLEQKGYIDTHSINFVTTLFVGGIGTIATISLFGF